MENASISVSPEIAIKYNKITPEEQLKVQAMMSLLIEDLNPNGPKTTLKEKITAWILMSTWIEEMGSGKDSNLGETMDMISDRAAERGLTPEILEELLADES